MKNKHGKSGLRAGNGSEKKRKIALPLLLILAMMSGTCSCSRTPEETPGRDFATGFYPEIASGEEIAGMKRTIREWFDGLIAADVAPFSFSYGRSNSEALWKTGDKEIKEAVDEAGNDTVSVICRDKRTGLTVTLDAVFYHHSPTVEFVLHLRNDGETNTQVISDFNSCDFRFDLRDSGDRSLTLDTARGCRDTEDYLDHGLETYRLAADGGEQSFHPAGGRSSDGAWPFFDILGDRGGLMFAVGWTGQWRASFTNRDGTVHVQAGLENFAAYLLPGEEIRTPAYSVTYFEGSAEYGHNLFRRLALREYTPDTGTEDRYVMPIDLNEWGGRTTEEILADIEAYRKAGVKADTVWVDAAWFLEDQYVESGDPNGWVYSVGSWQTNPLLHPSGSMKAISDAAHANGMKFMLWVEFERAWNTSDYAARFRDHYYPLEQAGSLLLKLSEEETYRFALASFSRLIEIHGIDIYRQDFNMSPLAAWLDFDGEGRTGITESKYIANLYRLYDALLEKYPGLMIDTCASGGRRIDFELLKRAQPMVRSDYTCYGPPHTTCEGIQFQTQSLSYWLPLSGTTFPQGISTFYTDYTFRSSVSPTVSLPWDQTGAGTSNKIKLRRYVEELLAVRPLFYGDYYQLLPATYDTTSWQVYELMRSDWQQALLVVYARPDTKIASQTFRLKGLIPDQTYSVQSVNDFRTSDNVTYFSGEALMTEGFTVTLAPSSAEFWFVKPVTESAAQPAASD